MADTCPNGHLLTQPGQFCPQCGAPVAKTEPVAAQSAWNWGAPGSRQQGAAPPPRPAPPAAYPPPYGPGGYQVPPSRGTNGLAVASLVLGILWLYGVGSLLAFIFGLVGRKQISRSRGSQSGGGLAIAGIVLGAVGVVGAVLLTVTLVVASNSINHSTAQSACISDFRTVEVAAEAYKAQTGVYPSNVNALLQTATVSGGSTVGPWLAAPPVNPGRYQIAVDSNGNIAVYTTDVPPTEIGSSGSTADCALVH